VATALAAAVGGRRAVPALVAVFALGPLAFTAVGPVAGWAYPNFALSPLTAEFALGVLAYRLTASLPKWAGWALLAPGVVGLMASCVAGRECGPQVRIIADPLLAWTRVGLFGVPAFACVLGTARLDHAGTFLPVARSATAAGAVSYSLYLAQPFAFAATALICIASEFTQPWPVAAVTVVSSLALAALAARYLDLPMHAVAKGWAKRLAAPTGAGAARPALVLPSLGPRATR